jgi:hypothetical protein
MSGRLRVAYIEHFDGFNRSVNGYLPLALDVGKEKGATCPDAPFRRAFPRDMGRAIPAKHWSEEQFEALRIEDEDGNIHVYSMYDRACEFFGVPALTVRQLPAFKAAAALGLIRRSKNRVVAAGQNSAEPFSP